MAKKEDPESIQKLVTLSARRFVKNVADVTPPAIGKADSLAKKRGEAAVLRDLIKIALPVTVAGNAQSARAARETLATAEQIITAHAGARVGGAGRVDRRQRQNRGREELLTSRAEFNRALKILQSRVGWLAAGLNAAAARLGAPLPAWIKRHGSKFGRIQIRASKFGLAVRIVQDVPFADDVQGYPRRWDFALQKEIKSLVNQAKAIFAKKAARAKARLAKK